MADLIDRQAAIDAVLKRDANCGIDAAETLKALPSAQPTDEDIQRMQDIEQAALEKAYECGKQDAMQWIPCEERLPEPGVSVLVDVADIPAGGRFPLIDEICKDGEWLNCDGSEWLALAWMPIPDPWKGKNDG